MLSLAQFAGDELLCNKGLLAKAELLQLAVRPLDSLHALNEVIVRLGSTRRISTLNTNVCWRSG